MTLTIAGLVLCKYGIEYVDDGKGSRIPTCHRTLPMAIMEDDDFQQACEYADITAKNIYRDEAKVIDKIQKKILNIAVNEDPYDIFICYKETDDITASRTEDSLIAQDIYTELIRDDYRVFFSRVSLREVADTEYEPYIYAALSSAKIMLAIGTKHDYYDAVWVKNEWSRFISMMGEDSSKVLIPCFKNMDAYDMPKEFKNMQALDMGDVTFFASLTESIERIIDKSRGKVSKETIVLNNDIGDVAPLLERGFIFLEDKDWKKADTFFETVLNKDPKNGNAYLGKLLVDLNVSKFEELSEFFTSFSDNYNYEKIMRFGDSELKESVKNCNDIIARRIEEARKKDIYENALEIMGSATTEEMFENAGYMFIEVKDYEDAKQKSEECFEKAEVARIKAEEAEKDANYKSACAVFDDKHYWHGKETDIRAFEESMETFIRLNGWRDSEEKIVLCQQRIADIKKRIEAERLEQEQQKAIARKEAEIREKRNLKLGYLVVVAIVLIAVFISFVLPKIRLNNAMKMLELKDYDSAYALLDKLGETETIYSSKYDRATEFLEAKEYDLALELFIQIFDYKDSAEIAKKIYFKKNPELKIAEVSDYVTFGSYEQDNDTSNGKEEIEWLVLKKEENRILVISKYGLDCQPYNTKEVDFTTWDVCTLREWLDSDFALNAFTDIEQKLIPEVTISSESWNNSTNSSVDGQKIKVLGGIEIQAKVFLLKKSEASKYFASDKERQCIATDYAAVNGVVVDDNMNCSWWLRSCTFIQNNTATVSDEGVMLGAGTTVYHESTAVRPAMWITIE